MSTRVKAVVYEQGRVIPIEVEVSSRQGVPSLVVIGLAAQAVHEARERLLAAATNTGMRLKSKRTVVNLSPIDIKKTSAALDLAMMVGIWDSHGLWHNPAPQAVWIGELALDGTIKRVPELQTLVNYCHAHDITELVVPEVQRAEITVPEGMHVHGLRHLKQLLSLHSEVLSLPLFSSTQTTHPKKPELQLEHIPGQVMAKRALLIALAGHHHCILSGPPGIGKTYLVQAAAHLSKQPISQPHYSSSAIGLIGGGPHGEPGEMTRAHQRILILDEVSEFSRSALEALRQPLSTHQVHLARAGYHHTHRTQVTMLATTNRCACGWLGSKLHPCYCTPYQVQKYHSRLSGAFLDRIHLFVPMDDQIVPNAPELPSAEFQSLLTATQERIQNTPHLPLTSSTTTLLQELATQGHSLRRQYLLKSVAITIAHLDTTNTVQPHHLMEAVTYLPQANSDRNQANRYSIPSKPM